VSFLSVVVLVVDVGGLLDARDGDTVDVDDVQRTLDGLACERDDALDVSRDRRRTDR